MKYVFFCFLTLAFSGTEVVAQYNHFLYFQTETKHPFYIRLNEKILNSSSAGYLIVPELKAGKYKLVIGFPKNEWPEQVLNYTIEKDAGFLLKNFSDKGWGLFDLQSLKVIMAGNSEAVVKSNEEEINKDSFSEMLAAVVNDSTIKQRPTISDKPESEKPKKESAQPAEPVIEVKQANQQLDTVMEVLYSVITKNLQVKGKDGMELMYIDEYKRVKDTIRILMPGLRDQEAIKNLPAAVIDISNNGDTGKNMEDAKNSNAIGGEQKKNSSNVIAEENKNIQEGNKITGFTDTVKSVQNEQISNPVAIEEETKNLAKKIAEENKNTLDDGSNLTGTDKASNIKDLQISDGIVSEEEKKDTVKGTIEEKKMEFLTVKPGVNNTNCKQYATEDDFLKLRKKMAAESNDDDMLRAAKRAFKAKCFTTKEIKNLGTLFLSDEGKYNFFSAAYSYVSDPDIFYSLENQFSDDYFVKRFKAMLR